MKSFLLPVFDFDYKIKDLSVLGSQFLTELVAKGELKLVFNRHHDVYTIVMFKPVILCEWAVNCDKSKLSLPVRKL